MKKILISIAFAGTAYMAQAQDSNPELKNLINQSFTYFPKFRELDQAVKTNQLRVEMAGLENRPNVGSNLGYNYVWPVPTIDFPDGNGNTKKFSFQPNHNINTAINVSAPIIDFGRSKANVDRVKEDLQQSRNSIEYTKAQLAAQVANIYYTMIYLQRNIQIEDSVIAVLQANKEFVQNKYKNGDALKVDVLTWDNNIDIEQNRKVDLQNNLQKQINLLAYATGQTPSAHTASGFDFSLTAASVDEALKTAQTSNYDYIMAHQRVKQSEADVANAKLSNKPTVTLNGSTGFRNGYVPELNVLKYNYAVGVGINIPIYSGGRSRKQVEIAQSAVTQNELAINTLDNQYRRDIEQAFTDIRSNQDRLNNTQGQIAVAREVLRLSQLRYKDGVGTNVDVLNANNNLQRVEQSQLQYQYQLTIAQIELARLMGSRYW